MSHPYVRRALLASGVFAATTMVALLIPEGRAHGDPPVDDGVPSGTVAFFAGSACPAGWRSADTYQGRMIVGAVDPTTVGLTVGTPLGDHEDRTHTHAITGSVTIAAGGVAASDGSNNAGAAAGDAPIAGTAAALPSGMAFVQLLTCEKP